MTQSMRGEGVEKKQMPAGKHTLTFLSNIVGFNDTGSHSFCSFPPPLLFSGWVQDSFVVHAQVERKNSLIEGAFVLPLTCNAHASRSVEFALIRTMNAGLGLKSGCEPRNKRKFTRVTCIINV